MMVTGVDRYQLLIGVPDQVGKWTFDDTVSAHQPVPDKLPGVLPGQA